MKIEAIDYPRVFPWVHLFRAFWIAVDFRKLILAGAALLAIAEGTWVCDQLPFAPAQSDPAKRPLYRATPGWPWQQPLGYDRESWGRNPLREGRDLLSNPGNMLLRIGTNGQLVLWPVETILEPAAGLFRADATWSRLAYDVTRLLWALAVWSLFGGAIGRMAAVQFARDQHIGMWSALKFSATRILDYLAAPLLPLVGVALLWGMCAAGGLLGRIPVAGEIIVGVLWGFGLILGFLMTLVLIGVAVGWPLMFATINVEATDGFDGLSRAYSYVYERPWNYLWYALVAMAYGSLMVFFVWFMGNLMLFLTVWGVAWGMGFNETTALLAYSPRLLSGDGGAFGPPNSPEFAGGSWGAAIVGVWLHGVALLIVAFVSSYFWTSTTITYFLLRRIVDANDFDEIHLDEEAERDELLPLVGTAATSLPVVQAPTIAPSVATTPPANPSQPEGAVREQSPPVDLTP